MMWRILITKGVFMMSKYRSCDDKCDNFKNISNTYNNLWKNIYKMMCRKRRKNHDSEDYNPLYHSLSSPESGNPSKCNQPRTNRRQEFHFKVDILEFEGRMQHDEFIDWLCCPKVTKLCRIMVGKFKKIESSRRKTTHSLMRDDEEGT